MLKFAVKNSNHLLPVALTTGEPAGIGPEIATRAVYHTDRPVCLLGDKNILESHRVAADLPQWPAHVSFAHVPLGEKVVPGTLNRANAAYVLETLRIAATGAMDGTFGAVCTAPVQKSIINDAGHAFTGHTEFFADTAGVKKVVMMLTESDAEDALRVALVTTHVPIAKLASLITRENVRETLQILYRELTETFGITSPRIAVTGLNPHAGESGHMGREEIDVIAPEIAAAQDLGWNVTGPYPADTVFSPAKLKAFDAVLCMYHDQGLPVLKHKSFGHGVNITLGLPFIRTSVDHGTALDIAGTGKANIESLLTALRLAHSLIDKKKQYA